MIFDRGRCCSVMLNKCSWPLSSYPAPCLPLAHVFSGNSVTKQPLKRSASALLQDLREKETARHKQTNEEPLTAGLGNVAYPSDAPKEEYAGLSLGETIKRRGDAA